MKYLFRTFLSIVKKEFYHILRDTRTLFILLGMPVILVILFGFAITNEIKDAKIAILDHSNDRATQLITQKIISSNYFKLEEALQRQEQIKQVFQKGEVKLVIVFENAFEQKLEKKEEAAVQLIADATDPNVANTLISYVSAIIRDYQNQHYLSAGLPLQISTQTRMLYNPRLEGAFYFVPGVITVILMLVSAMMTSITIAREKEFGNMEVLLVSPLQPVIIILGKAVPYVFLSLFNAVSVLYIGYVVFNMPLTGNMVLLMLELFLFIITSLSLGILISTVTNNQQTALLISLMGLMLPTILLSGFVFPIESMPRPLQYVSHAIPAKWFIIIIKDIMLKGSGLAIVWKETLILMGITIFFLLLSVKKFSIRLE
ncbi:MAG: ABC transporter permease [Candidatus Cyclobacteriaceae bacterium M3_2C_046]